MMYSTGFYDAIRDGCQMSAARVVPRIIELFEPDSVLDVGCGEGWWGKEFADYGVERVTGCDGSYVQSALTDFVEIDLQHEFLPSDWEFDLIVCLEVAEHLSAQRAPSFIEDLCNVAPVVVFSAAIPGQTGAGHVNCQWPDYWKALFNERGFAVSGKLRWEFWADDDIEPWYRQNLLIAAQQMPTELAEDEVLHVVHPDIWSWKL